MDKATAFLLSMAGLGAALIALYLFANNGTSITNEFGAIGGFVTSESKILQGR